MSRVLPILFNTDMVRAILREVSPKTATRRAIKGYIPSDAMFGYTAFTPKGYISCRGTFADGYGEKFFKLPCQKGDILYVRETWCNLNTLSCPCYYYKASDNLPEWALGGWRPSIHMPKEATRIWLRVTDVRVERLQDISAYEVLKEGVDNAKSNPAMGKRWENMQMIAFSELWDSTIKKSDQNMYGWAVNPQVWVIEFERCEKPKGENNDGTKAER